MPGKRRHPKRKPFKAGRKTGVDPKLEAALKSMRHGFTLTDSAKRHHVSRSRLRAYAKTHAGARREGGGWTFDDERIRQLPIFSEGEVRIVRVRGYEPAMLGGRHWNEALQALKEPEEAKAFARRWEGISIRDTSGRRHPLATDLNEIYSAAHAHEEPYEQIYKLVG
jgi:hypothetical protein